MREALGYPTRGEHAEKALLSAWLCVLVHSIVIPVVTLVPLLGYAATILADENDEPPSFLERALVGRSLGATVLVVGYGVVPVGTALVAILLLTGGDQPPTDADALFVLVGSTAVLAMLAAYAYLVPIALANYVRAGSLRAGCTGLGAVAGDAVYFVGWASGAIVLLVGVGIAGAFVDLGGIFAVVGSFVGAYAALIASRRVGRGYAAATE
ncbi:DUF4013 domain-containing protein [Natrialba sp. INN-245]|uniref:DUF4013 domain-containing protein n=1 Tax=Natrialba sp. INN-245 TaxID=2690967 RepID=UPI0013102AA9|nr:DUF4013 domain-containing protein [Natrialba sp. INN-245]MWV41082.1 DUF4013 domain-containing protein [Natrialba sp. INN-245]